MQRSIIRALFLSGILTVFFVAGACAAHIERLPESSDYSTISAMKNDIVDEVNAIAEEGAEQEIRTLILRSRLLRRILTGMRFTKIM